MALRLFTAALVVLSITNLCVGQDKQADPREDLKTAIPEAIKLLEAKDYETFIKSYVLPEDLEKILKRTTLEDLVNGFKGKKADALLEALNSIKGLQPELNEKGDRAEFKRADERSVYFQKVDRFWYICN